MNIKYETWASVNDLIYRIIGLTVETWRVTRVCVTMDASLTEPESYYTTYYIEPVSHRSSYNDFRYFEENLKKSFCRSKNELIQRLNIQI